MNRALLQTYVRSTLTREPKTAETIAAEIQKQFPHEKEVTNSRVAIILNQLYHAGLCSVSKNSNTEMLYYNRKPLAT